MNDQIETANETVAEELWTPSNVTTVVVWSLAIYGGQDLTRRGVKKFKEIRANRKLKKAAEKAETTTEQ